MRKLRPQVINLVQIGRFLTSAERKLIAARKTLAFDAEASYQLAYEAMLKASLGFMLSHGVRPRALPGHHITVIEFARQHLGKAHDTLMAVFDRMRRKRHQAIYEVNGLISESEAQQALAIAEKYLAVIRGDVQKRYPRLPRS